jgi:hypothetical protein
LGKFIVDTKQGQTFLSAETYTFEIERGNSQSFIFHYDLKDTTSILDWRKSFLTVEYFGTRDMHYLIAPLEDGARVAEDDVIDLTRYGFTE